MPAFAGIFQPYPWRGPGHRAGAQVTVGYEGDKPVSITCWSSAGNQEGGPRSLLRTSKIIKVTAGMLCASNRLINYEKFESDYAGSTYTMQFGKH